MIAARYGVKLIRLRQEHIELLRTWRNADKISRFMEFRDHITPKMQQQWFDGLNPHEDFYFMIEYHGQLVGMIHTSGVNWQEGRGDAGLFIFEDRYLSTYTPVLASLCMVDLFFGVFSLQRLYAKVMRNNPVAADYNRRLGFKLMPGQEAMDFQMFELSRDDYFAATAMLRAKAIAVEGNHFTLQISEDLQALLQALGAFRNLAEFDLKLETTK